MNIAGVTYPKGFKATGVACGIKKDGGLDVALLTSDCLATCAGVFTKNVVKGHSLQLCREYVNFGNAKAVFINSGNANACVGKQGELDALAISELVASNLGCESNQVMIGSTGVIGVTLPMGKIAKGIEKAVNRLSENGGGIASKAIMTTDTYEKQAEEEIVIHGKSVRIGAMAKGSGMIFPNMATMISIITSDVKIEKEQADALIKKVANQTYNRVCVDGDTSVCDKVLFLANGQSEIDYDDCKEEFEEALLNVATKLSKMLAKDGEGATKLITVKIKGAKTFDDAKLIAHAIAKSPLCKTAAFGEDANWGRLLTAAGYSGAEFDANVCDVYIGDMITCENGTGIEFDENRALEILKKDEIEYIIDLKQGEFDFHMWTCDLSYDYVKINGSYRT